MSKKNNRPYQPIDCDKEKEKLSPNANFGKNPLADTNLIGAMLQVILWGWASLGWFIYQSYQLGLAQASLGTTIGLMTLSTILFVIMVLILGISIGHLMKTQGKAWGTILFPLSIVLWAFLTYNINNFAMSQ